MVIHFWLFNSYINYYYDGDGGNVDGAAGTRRTITVIAVDDY